MPLALFDLDNTLLAGDSDYLWGSFLVKKGLVDKNLYEQANQRFYEDYKNGNLDIHEFLAFALTPLAENKADDLRAMHAEFMAGYIEPIMNRAGKNKIEEHRAKGDYPVIITATNSFVTGPIAAAFGINRREKSEIHVHRLKGLGFGATGNMGDQGAHRGFGGRSGQFCPAHFGHGKAPCQQSHRRTFDIALNPGDLPGKADVGPRP